MIGAVGAVLAVLSTILFVVGVVALARDGRIQLLHIGSRRVAGMVVGGALLVGFAASAMLHSQQVRDSQAAGSTVPVNPPATSDPAATDPAPPVVVSSADSAPLDESTVDMPEPTDKGPYADLSCADVGGVFEVHGTDGRGDCVPADSSPECHVPPLTGAQSENYLADLTMTPPFPGGVIDSPQSIEFADNRECWRLPSP